MDEHRARLNEIGAWSAMNANLQTHLLAAKAAGLDPQRSVIPWGNSHSTTHIHQQTAGWAAKLILAGAAGLGLGAGGLGLAQLAGLVAQPPPAAPSPTPEYEWILEVERGDERQGRIEQFQLDRSGSGETVGEHPRANPRGATSRGFSGG
jgi:hypothetical protein